MIDEKLHILYFLNNALEATLIISKDEVILEASCYMKTKIGLILRDSLNNDTRGSTCNLFEMFKRYLIENTIECGLSKHQVIKVLDKKIQKLEELYEVDYIVEYI